MLERHRQAWGQDGGQVLVIAAGAMVALLAMAALAIDVGSWYQVKRQAQSTAEAAALAAVQDLPASPATAMATAQSYVDKNISGALPTTITTPYGGSSNEIQVTVNVSSPSTFGKLLGVTSANISATAVAVADPNCATPGNGCYAIFASDSNCGTSGSPHYAVTVPVKNTTISGAVNSQGSIDLIGTGQSLGPTTYGTGANCKITPAGGGTPGNHFMSGPVSQAAEIGWRDDYSSILTACGGAGQVDCGVSGTPSYCTRSASSFDFNTTPLVANTVWCAYGTGTLSDPATWTGLIKFSSGALGSSGSAIPGTWIGGTIWVAKKSFLGPYTPSYPVFYAAGSGDCSTASAGGVCMTAAGSGVDGGIFAPNGTIEFNGSGSTTFLESKDVNITGSFTGGGPPLSPSGATSSGTGSLRP